MKILSEMPTGMGGKWVLVNYGNNFYAYGTEDCLHDLLGFPVNQCGSKEEVIKHCKSISKLCKQNIDKYKKEFAKEDMIRICLVISMRDYSYFDQGGS